jgi:hypothetical protein
MSISSEGKTALIGMAIDVGSILVRRIFDAITKNDDQAWKSLDDIFPDTFKTKLALLRQEEKARQAIAAALEKKPG